MKNYEKEISEAARAHWRINNYPKGESFGEEDFTAGVNSEIAAKIREDAMIEFGSFLSENDITLRDNGWDDGGSVMDDKGILELFYHNRKTN